MTSTPMLDITEVSKLYGSSIVVDGVSLAVRKGEVIALLGPSGCGKTTLLRMIANLVAPSSGEIRIDGRSIIGRRPHLSEASMLFQSYALFPHLTVKRNVGFGLEIRHLPRPEMTATIGRMLDIVRLRGFEQRRPNQLSGGQQQRVALARALAVSPKILLLDEPFGALDRKLREETAIDVLRVIRELEMTTIFVTHDQDEALTMADRIAVMEAGRIVQIASGVEIYTHPETEFVAQFVGVANLLSGVLLPAAIDHHFVLATETGLEIPVTAYRNLAAGTPLSVLIRPENIRLQSISTDRPATTPGRIAFSVQYGSHTDYQVELQERILKVRSTPTAFTLGELVDVEVADPKKCVLFQQGVRVR
jgi:ABC-type Fe3+/spermidine/putrescine transport system ATPase subunit